MNDELIFSIVNGVAFIGWVFLVLFPFSRLLKRILFGIIIIGFALLYLSLLATSFQPGTFESFSTLEGIGQLFSNPTALLTGWIHYLAFDMMVGLYITNNAEKYGINRFFLIPCLFFTFMLGPVGLLLYVIVRSIYTKNYFEPYD